MLADGSEFCNSGFYAYDSFRPGLQVDGTNLDPFCITVDRFAATYDPNGQPSSFRADVRYQDSEAVTAGGGNPGDGTRVRHTLAVNDPLRIGGERVYLLGHGYAPQFTVTFPSGETRTDAVQFRPADATTLLSEGALRFDPPAGTYPDADQRRRNQIAIEGLFAPTASLNGTLLGSSFPGPRDPAVAVDVYRGDAGLDSGKPSSIFSLDPQLAKSGRLVKQERVNLKPGDSVTLGDGTRVRFDQVQEWVSLQTSQDPGQLYVLGFALTMTLGLMVSLVVKRRRIWVRLLPEPDGPGGAPGRTVVEFGGLARTDQAGWGEEFGRLTAELLAPASTNEHAESSSSPSTPQSPESEDGRHAHRS